MRARLNEPGRRRLRRRVEHVVSNFVPRYYQVYTVLAQRVREGEWTPERPMPTEQDFSAAFNVSRVTIRKALNMLQEEGLILRQQGRGTFAVPPARKQGRANMSGLLENVAGVEVNTLRCAAPILEHADYPARGVERFDRSASEAQVPACDRSSRT